jgi:hypothetical protein
MIVVLVLGFVFGFVAHVARTARIQRDAVVAIVNAGGRVTYDWEWSNGKSISGGKLWVRGRLTNLVGADYFGQVTAVRLFSSSRATDATLAHVGRLTRLQGLYDNSSSVTDAGLAHLKELTSLSILNLTNTQITDVGLVHLKRLSSLSELALQNTGVTDAGLVHLKALTNLLTLDLHGTHVTDAGMNELKQALPSLTIIK